MSDYDAWAPVYDALASDMTEDVAYYVELARAADGPIVELMVGSGRVAIEVVRQTGKAVIGIDSSSAMLALARERATDLPLKLRLADIRNLGLDEPAAPSTCRSPSHSVTRSRHGSMDRRRTARGSSP